MGRIKHLNDKEFDMALDVLNDALQSNKPTEMKENVGLAIRLLKKPDGPDKTGEPVKAQKPAVVDPPGRTECNG